MRQPIRSTLAVVAALAAGAGLGVGLDWLGAAPAPGAGQRSVPVRSADLVCPGGNGVPATVTVAAPPDRAGTTATGATPVTTRPLSAKGTGTPLVSVVRPGTLATTSIAEAPVAPLVTQAKGPLAAGLNVEQVAQATAGAHRGLAGVACLPPAPDFWFVATATTDDRQSLLYLTNDGDGIAEVDVKVYGPQGPVESVAARSIQVDPHTQREVRVDSLAPGLAAVALHVESRTGRVAAGVLDNEYRSLTGYGSDWLPVSAAPSRTTVVPAVPAGNGEQTLYLLSPDAGTTARVRVAGADGGYLLAEADSVPLAAGRVVAKTFKLRGRAGALVVEADAEVLAGVRVVRSAGKGADTAFLAGTTALRDRAVLADARSGAVATTLLLTARSDEAEVLVTEFSGAAGAGGQPRQRSVRVPRDTTVAVELAGGARFGVLVESRGPGLVYGTRWLYTKAGPDLTLLPLGDARYTAVLPEVSNDLSAGQQGVPTD